MSVRVVSIARRSLGLLGLELVAIKQEIVRVIRVRVIRVAQRLQQLTRGSLGLLRLELLALHGAFM